MVGNHVDHHPNALCVGSVNKGLQLCRSAEVGVDAIPILGPISVITTSIVVDYGRDPDRVKSHTFDIIKAVLDTRKSATAVV